VEVDSYRLHLVNDGRVSLQELMKAEMAQ
jgi:hypothetical protein